MVNSLGCLHFLSSFLHFCKLLFKGDLTKANSDQHIQKPEEIFLFRKDGLLFYMSFWSKISGIFFFGVPSGAEIRPLSQWDLGDFFPNLKKKIPISKKKKKKIFFFFFFF